MTDASLRIKSDHQVWVYDQGPISLKASLSDKVKVIKFISLLFFSFFSNANERDCSTLDFSSRLGPIRDQGYVGTCYAHAAANLVSFETGLQISAGQIAAASGSDSDIIAVRSAADGFRKKFGCKPQLTEKTLSAIGGAAFVDEAIAAGCKASSSGTRGMVACRRFPRLRLSAFLPPCWT